MVAVTKKESCVGDILTVGNITMRMGKRFYPMQSAELADWVGMRARAFIKRAVFLDGSKDTELVVIDAETSQSVLFCKDVKDFFAAVEAEEHGAVSVEFVPVDNDTFDRMFEYEHAAVRVVTDLRKTDHVCYGEYYNATCDNACYGYRAFDY